MRLLKITLLLLLVTTIPVLAGKITNGEELVKSMHKKYKGKWYKTLTFVQKNTRYLPGGKTQNTVWYEAMALPGKLRVDFGPLDQNNGMIFNEDKQHMFNGGKLVRSIPRVHSLLVLGFDVYRQPAETTIKQLKDLKFDLSIIHKAKWQGRKVYVVGAKKGDLKSRQFWIDKKNLYFVRMIQPAGPNGNRTQEIQFNKYQKVKSGGWISPEVLFLVDGKRNFLEEYTKMQFNVELKDELFEPEKWTKVDRNYFKIKN